MYVVRSDETIQRYVAKFDMANFLIPAYTSIYIEQDEQHFL